MDSSPPEQKDGVMTSTNEDSPSAASAPQSPTVPPTVYGWKGFSGDLNLQVYPPLAPYKIRSVAAGGGHVLFLTDGGKVFGRGHNAHGQLGLGPELLGQAQAEPLLIPSLADLETVAIAAGRSHSAAVTVDGDVYCWGDSSEGQCGTGTLDIVLTPTLVTVAVQEGFCQHGVPRPHTRVSVDSIACGSTHTLAVSVEDEVWAWGCGEQLGLEDLHHAPVPRRVDALTGRRVLMVACGDAHSVALLQKLERPNKANASPVRNRNVSKDHIVTQKHFPSLCTRCSQEIYTYTDTNDTCIIDNAHECSADDSNFSFDNSTLSLDGPNPVPTGADPARQNADSSVASGFSGGDHIDTLATDQKKSLSPIVGETNNALQEITESQLGQDPGTAPTGSETENQMPSSAENVFKNNSPVPKTSSVISGCTSQAEGKVIESECVESDGEVWKRQSASEEKVPQPAEEKVTSLDGGSSSPVSRLSERSRTPSTSSMASLSRARSFVDEQQAREYLSRQFEEEDVLEQLVHRAEETHSSKRKTEEDSESQSSWKSFLPYSSSVMATVKSVTSKALTNIQNTMDSLVGPDSTELGDMSRVPGSPTPPDPAPATTQPMTESTSSLEFGAEAGLSSPSTDNGRSSQSPPSLSHDSPPPLNSPEGRQSLRTLEMKQQNLEKRISASAPKDSVSEGEPPAGEVIVDTEVWCWGSNNKGQLGLGDTINRNKPVCVKVLNNKCVLKVAAGANHTIALTSHSQIYTWGSNNYNQLGHSESGISPARIKFMRGCSVWDVAAGANHSLFLTDTTGVKPDIFYCGKQPGKDAHSPMQKAPVPTVVMEIKKMGWVRGVNAGGDNCYCLMGTAPPSLSNAIHELASTERSFYQELVKINMTLLKPLTKSPFYTATDVFPYKSALDNLVSGFVALSKKVGEGVIDLTDVVKADQKVTTASLIRSHSLVIQEFRRYSRFFADFLAIGGFEYCALIGSEFFDKYHGRDSPSRVNEERPEGKTERAFTRFQRSMQFPFLRLKDYSRLLQTLADSMDPESSNLLQQAVVGWDTLKLTVTADHKQANVTRQFWEAATPKLADALRIPSRRVLMDSKSHPLLMPAAGRFSSHFFILFSDMFVHLQSGNHTIFPLETLWVETPVTDSDQLPAIVVIAPEDRIELNVTSAAEKAVWLMAFNSAINKALSSQKDVGRRGSAERLSPPLARHAHHTFARHLHWKDGSYTGTWLSGKLHGQGEIKWPDGRKYTGMFKHGQQNGPGVMVIPRGGSSKEVQDGSWRDGKLDGTARIKYANGDEYCGHFQSGQRTGHGVLQQGRHLASYASIYVGEWLADKRQGYGVQDDILKGEKYMGMWVEDYRHGNGIMVTLDGMYFEGNFYVDKLQGFGLMLTDDNSCYEGEFQDITQLSGKGALTLPTGDRLEGSFNGSWNEGLKVNGTFVKCSSSLSEQRRLHSSSPAVKSKHFGQLSVAADAKWEELFHHCCSSLGHDSFSRNVRTNKAWEMVAVAVSNGKKQLKEMQKMSAAKARLQAKGLEELEVIPPHDASSPLTVEAYHVLCQYMRKALDTVHHPLGVLMEQLVDVFRAAYVGVGAHPRLLPHAVQEINSYVRRIYMVLRILFPQLPADGGPLRIYPENYVSPPIPITTQEVNAFLDRQQSEDNIGEIITAAGLLYPVLLPKLYPPLFDLYALYCDRDDERYWDRVTKLNRQGDMALMAFLGIDQKYWLMDDILLGDKSQKLSSTRDVCYASAVDALQQLSTAFSPMDKLLVIEATFNEISQTVQGLLGEEHVWCMDDLFPIFQFVVVRAKIRHLGAEISMVDDLIEPHMEHGELGIMFTTLKASFFQIQNEKMPHH